MKMAMLTFASACKTLLMHAPENSSAVECIKLPAGQFPIIGWLRHFLVCPHALTRHVWRTSTRVPPSGRHTFFLDGPAHLGQVWNRARRLPSNTRYFLSSKLGAISMSEPRSFKKGKANFMMILIYFKLGIVIIKRAI